MLDKRFLDELRTRLNLSDIVGQRVKLTRAGREHKACCPFHQEKSPSFTVNDAKGFFHCFGCGAHGDIVSFRMRADNVTFIEAVESLAAQANLEVPKQTIASPEKLDEMQRLRQTLEAAARWFEMQLHSPLHAFALRYLRERGVSDAMIAQYRIGYAPNNWDNLREAMLAQNLRLADLVTLGLLKHSTRDDKADKPYAFFRGRIMFPVTDLSGRVIAFGGRHLDAAFAGQTLTDKPAKYINSQEHPLFNKSAVLYGMARARAQIGHDAPPILVEGYLDVISLAQAGFGTAVAPLGTALTEEHMQLAWKTAMPGQPPVLCFDGDAAGQNAAYRAIDRILPHVTAQKALQLLFLPGGEDPDSLIRTQGAGAFKALLGQTIGIFDALWQRETGQTPDTPEGRAALQARMEAHLKAVQDPMLAQSYRQALRDRMFQFNRTQYAARAQSTNRFGGKWRGKWPSIYPAIRPGITPSRPGARADLQAWQAILTALLAHPHVLPAQLARISADSAPHPDLEALRQALVQWGHSLDAGQGLTSDAAKQFLSERGLNDMLASLNQNMVHQLYRFTRDDAPLEQVLTGLQDVWARMQHKTMTQDMLALRQQIRTQYSDDIAERITAFGQSQFQELADDLY